MFYLIKVLPVHSSCSHPAITRCLHLRSCLWLETSAGTDLRACSSAASVSEPLPFEFRLVFFGHRQSFLRRIWFSGHWTDRSREHEWESLLSLSVVPVDRQTIVWYFLGCCLWNMLFRQGRVKGAWIQPKSFRFGTFRSADLKLWLVHFSHSFVCRKQSASKTSDYLWEVQLCSLLTSCSPSRYSTDTRPRCFHKTDWYWNPPRVVMTYSTGERQDFNLLPGGLWNYWRYLDTCIIVFPVPVFFYQSDPKPLSLTPQSLTLQRFNIERLMWHSRSSTSGTDDFNIGSPQSNASPAVRYVINYLPE